jgi:hypothetical protein
VGFQKFNGIRKMGIINAKMPNKSFLFFKLIAQFAFMDSTSYQNKKVTKHKFIPKKIKMAMADLNLN